MHLHAKFTQASYTYRMIDQRLHTKGRNENHFTYNIEANLFAMCLCGNIRP